MNIALIVIAMVSTCAHAMENVPQTPDQVVLTIGNSDNPALGPLKLELNTFSELLNQELEGAERDRKRKRDGDDPQGAVQLVSGSTPPTPFNTPAQNAGTRRRILRPRALNTAAHDLGIGIGNMSLDGFYHQSLSQDNSPDNNLIAPPPSPTLLEGITGIEASIKRLEILSARLLGHENQLTKQEQKAVAYLNAASKKESYVSTPEAIAAAIGAGLGTWITAINPGRIYRESCTKFVTGLEWPALLAAGKTLIGPVVAIVGIGILWYKFKQWIIEPYKEAHRTEIERLREAHAKHKTEVHEAIMITQKHSEDHHATIMEALNKIQQSNRQQLEHTIKEVMATETILRQKFSEFTTQAQVDLATINGNIIGFQHTKDDIEATIAQLLAKQKSTDDTVKKLIKDSKLLLETIKKKQLVVSPTSPASAPIRGNALAVPAPSPHSAQVRETQKRNWLGRSSKKSAVVAPLPLNMPDINDGERKHEATLG